MPRLCLPIIEWSEGVLRISGEEARYLRSVLRCKTGDQLQIFDGKGRSYNSIIEHITKKEITVKLLESTQLDAESPLNLILVQGLLKADKMELIIQKSTELGIKEIIPAITARSQFRETGKIPRWTKIAENASRQCGRTRVPVIHELIAFNDIFTKYLSIATRGIIFWEERGLPLKDALLNPALSKIPHTDDSPLLIFIGPAGGFTEEEVHIAGVAGLITASLGNRILRAETAAISSIAIIQTLLGDM